MGTKLEYAITLLANSQNSTNFSTSVQCVDKCYLQSTELNSNFQITGLDKYQLLSSSKHTMPENNNNTDLIRNTMQIQEDIFKHQVRELHRLYSVQKMLMEELKKEMKQKRKYWSPMKDSDNVNSNELVVIQQHNSTNYEYNFNIQEPSPKETSGHGSCSGETTRILTRGFDLERFAEEEMSTTGSTINDRPAGTSSSYLPFIGNKMSSSNNNNNINNVCSDEDESEVELTLSIGSGGNNKSNNIIKQSTNDKQNQELIDSPASIKSERAEDFSCSAPTTPISSSSTATTFDQERKHPHWLFQSLSLKRTT